MIALSFILIVIIAIILLVTRKKKSLQNTAKQSDDNKSTTSVKPIDPRYGTLDSQLSLSLKIREPSISSVKSWPTKS